MELSIDWNWDVKGILVIDTDKKCEDCIHRKEGETCSEKFFPNEFFCLYFEVNPKSAKKFPRISMANLESSGVFNIDGLIYFVSRGRENKYLAFHINEIEIRKGEEIKKLLNELLLLKGKGSSPGAREIRKLLRKLGFNLRRK